MTKTKHHLSIEPLKGRAFSVKLDGREINTALSAVHVTLRGADKPTVVLELSDADVELNLPESMLVAVSLTTEAASHD